MSTDTIISVEGVSKKFCRSLKKTMLYGVRDVASDLFGICQGSNGLRQDEFWALNDVSFEVKRGECLGLIGPNGAGKSTLLKLINGVTLPDKGSLRVNGCIGALLELGAGFHPMLTGRENIYLSAAILGLSKRKIEEKFDAIVDFAELAESIDTPVKYYSSGMYVRLGFAVAISIDPEILIIDESMSVGDTSFKKRCLDHIDAFSKAGKTIFVVTHNLQEIQRIATRVIVLDHGMIRADGFPDEALASYMALLNTQQTKDRWEGMQNNGNQFGAVIEIVAVALCGEDGRKKSYFRTHDELQVRVRYVAHQSIFNPVFRVQIYRSDGLLCHGMNTERHGINFGEVNGKGGIVLRYTDINLLNGDYSVHVSVLSSRFDEFPLQELIVSNGIHVESNIKDGGGVLAMPAEWLPFED
jgi:homopolymeric O-antigen transport system ATP-binding protein